MATTWPEVHYCACDRLEQEHELVGGTFRRRGTADGSCGQFELARTEERPPESELRRRLDAVLVLHCADGSHGSMCTGCGRASPCPTVLAAHGEVP